MRQTIFILISFLILGCGSSTTDEEENKKGKAEKGSLDQYEITYTQVASVEELCNIVASGFMNDDFSKINQVRLLPKDFEFVYNQAKKDGKFEEQDDYKVEINKTSLEREEVIKNRFSTIKSQLDNGGATDMGFLHYELGESDSDEGAYMEFQGVFAYYLINSQDTVYIRMAYTKINNELRLMALGDGVYKAE